MTPAPLQALIQLLRTLPGVGEKTAARYAMHLAGGENTMRLGTAIANLPLVVKPCPTCRALVDTTRPCPFCTRETTLLCVVHRYVDLLAVERAAAGLARYFVLGRVLSPLDGVHEQDLPVDALLAAAEQATEVVLCLPSSVDGQATALLLAGKLTSASKQVSCLARGLAHGADLEFADPITMRGAFDGRVRVTP